MYIAQYTVNRSQNTKVKLMFEFLAVFQIKLVSYKNVERIYIKLLKRKKKIPKKDITSFFILTLRK